MSRPVRLLIGYGVQALILFFVVGGLIYNVGGIRDKIAHHFAHVLISSVEKNAPTPASTPTAQHRQHHPRG